MFRDAPRGMMWLSVMERCKQRNNVMQFSVNDAVTVAQLRERERNELMQINAVLREARSESTGSRLVGLFDRLFRGLPQSLRPIKPSETGAAA
jgi:hypothetical protein